MTLSEAAHVVASHMEPMPPDLTWNPAHDLKWWKYVWVPKVRVFRPFPNDDKTGSLDALREVEERLTGVQWLSYGQILIADLRSDEPWMLHVIHASAEAKLLALAAVLRSDTEVKS